MDFPWLVFDHSIRQAKKRVGSSQSESSLRSLPSETLRSERDESERLINVIDAMRNEKGWISATNGGSQFDWRVN